MQYPGEFEAANRARHAMQLEFDPAIWRTLVQLADSLGVPLPAERGA